VNYCDRLVDYFTNFIFSEPIVRQSNTEFFRQFVTNVDKAGSSINQFMRGVCDNMQIFGMDYTLVDAPLKDGIVLSKADEIDLQVKPYWVSMTPIEVIDWAFDDFGNYIYFKRRQLIYTYSNGSKFTLEKFTEYTLDSIRITTVDLSERNKPSIISEVVVPNSLGVIPIVCTKFKDSKLYKGVGNSFLIDFSYNNREIMNLTSVLQEFLYRQAFNILTVQTDISNAGQPIVVGTTNTLEYPREADRPQYISPPVAPAEFLQSEIARIKSEMFSRAAQDTVNELFNGEGNSGFSQAQSFSRTTPFISTRADRLEETENKLMRLTFRYIDQEWDGRIKYKDRYEITNFADTLTQLLIICQDLKIPSETFVKEELKRVLREFDDKLPPDVKARIEKEVEAMSFKEWQSEIGQNKTSPGAQQKPKSSGTIQEISSESGLGSVNKVI